MEGSPGGAAVCRAVRWTLLLIAAWSIACISVPLGSEGPTLEAVSLPVAGDQAQSVRATFGAPQRLDMPTYWIYEWTTERKFVIAPVFPSGMPAGATVAGNRYRMLVEVDPEGRVERVECTARAAPEDGAPPLGCETPIEPLRAKAAPLFAYQLNGKPEFDDARFYQTELSGASTPMVLSPDGRLLAATDAKNRLWVIDTESGSIVHRHDGVPVKFFSLAPPGQVKAVFSSNGDRLVISQQKIGAKILGRSANGGFETVIELADDDLRQVADSGRTGEIIAFGELGLVTLQTDGSRSAAIDPVARLDFDVQGVKLIESSEGPADLVAVRFGQTWWTGGRTAVLSAAGLGVALLDLRNDYARVGKQGFQFSPDGVWLAHDTGRHLEIWPSAGLLGIVDGGLASENVAPRWVALMPFTHRKDEEMSGHLPIAFRDDGKLVAAASQVAIHVWRMDDGEPVALVGALTNRYHHPSREYFIEQAAPDAWPTLRVLALAISQENHLTAVFADPYFNIFVGAWQIGE